MLNPSVLVFPIRRVTASSLVLSSSHALFGCGKPTESKLLPSMAASDRTVLQFSSSSQSLTAKVHPLVVFNICDCYVRRPDQAERVIGTLLGSIIPDGTVDIRNSYAVPHNESLDQVSIYIANFSRLSLALLIIIV